MAHGLTSHRLISGLVKGPASSTDNAIARFDGTTGRVVQNSSATIDDNGLLSSSAMTGAYTPTVTGVTNNNGNGTLTSGSWLRIGNTVVVSGRCNMQASVAATRTVFICSLPIASNLTATSDLSGSGAGDGVANTQVCIGADTANDAAEFDFVPAVNTDRGYTFIFSYLVK